MDDLDRLRRAAGIMEDFGSEDMMTAGRDAEVTKSSMFPLMQALGQHGGPLANDLIEAGKVAHNMNGPEMWARIVRSFLGNRG